MKKHEQIESNVRDEKITRLQSLLRTSSDISKLLTRDTEADVLIQGVCDSLVRTSACENAWIVLSDSKMNIKTTASAGMGSYFLSIIEKFVARDLPECCKLALNTPGLSIIENPASICEPCSIAKVDKGNSVCTLHLEYKGNIFGFLHVTVQHDIIKEREVQSLIEGVGLNLSLALYTSALELQYEYISAQLEKLNKSKDKSESDHPIAMLNYDWKDKLILIVEDNEVDYRILQKILHLSRIQLIWVAKAEEALDIFKSNATIDLMITDIRLPGMNGIELTRKIRQLNKKIPILALTAFFNHDMKDQCLKAGCNEFLNKPVNRIEILHLISSHLNIGKEI